jgi:hypothetical protein
MHGMTTSRRDSRAPITEAMNVRDFVARYGIDSHLETALSLAQTHFEAQSIRVERSEDPEENAEWLVVLVKARGTPTELMEAHRRYVADWVKLSPPLTRVLIRLSYGGV